MTLFRVWAPQASRVELVLRKERREMSPAASGWWCLDASDVAAGADYWYSLDDGEPLPDPMSPWQPEGVHGPSRVVDGIYILHTSALSYEPDSDN